MSHQKGKLNDVNRRRFPGKQINQHIKLLLRSYSHFLA